MSKILLYKSINYPADVQYQFPLVGRKFFHNMNDEIGTSQDLICIDVKASQIFEHAFEGAHVLDVHLFIKKEESVLNWEQ